MVDWYNSIDVFLCTSIGEGSPATAMEALACGRPVVTTAVGDMPNLVFDGETGFLTGTYSNAESAETVIERTVYALRMLNDDRTMVERMGKAARDIMVRSRNWTELAPRWLAFIVGESLR
jgi:glycosyltransferase involved in cell wall biosynthesis